MESYYFSLDPMYMQGMHEEVISYMRSIAYDDDMFYIVGSSEFSYYENDDITEPRYRNIKYVCYRSQHSFRFFLKQVRSRFPHLNFKIDIF